MLKVEKVQLDQNAVELRHAELKDLATPQKEILDRLPKAQIKSSKVLLCNSHKNIRTAKGERILYTSY